MQGFLFNENQEKNLDKKFGKTAVFDAKNKSRVLALYIYMCLTLSLSLSLLLKAKEWSFFLRKIVEVNQSNTR